MRYARKKGMTLLEVIISIAILGIIITPMLSLSLTSKKTNAKSEDSIQAMALAQKHYEYLKSDSCGITYDKAASTVNYSNANFNYMTLTKVNSANNSIREYYYDLNSDGQNDYIVSEKVLMVKEDIVIENNGDDNNSGNTDEKVSIEDLNIDTNVTMNFYYKNNKIWVDINGKKHNCEDKRWPTLNYSVRYETWNKRIDFNVPSSVKSISNVEGNVLIIVDNDLDTDITVNLSNNISNNQMLYFSDEGSNTVDFVHSDGNIIRLEEELSKNKSEIDNGSSTTNSNELEVVFDYVKNNKNKFNVTINGEDCGTKKIKDLTEYSIQYDVFSDKIHFYSFNGKVIDVTDEDVYVKFVNNLNEDVDLGLMYNGWNSEEMLYYAKEENPGQINLNIRRNNTNHVSINTVVEYDGSQNGNTGGSSIINNIYTFLIDVKVAKADDQTNVINSLAGYKTQ